MQAKKEEISIENLNENPNKDKEKVTSPEISTIKVEVIDTTNQISNTGIANILISGDVKAEPRIRGDFGDIDTSGAHKG